MLLQRLLLFEQDCRRVERQRRERLELNRVGVEGLPPIRSDGFLALHADAPTGLRKQMIMISPGTGSIKREGP